MIRPIAILKTSSLSTRVLVRVGDDDVLKAVLPPSSLPPHPRALPTLLEAIALWHQAPVLAVLSAAESESWFRLGLVDPFYLGTDTVHYTVELRDRDHVRRHSQRIAGVGSFDDLRQLELRGVR
jgi:hypothetical protein